MYISECWGYDPIGVDVREYDGMVVLRLSCGSDTIAVTLTGVQLRQVEHTISRYLDQRAAKDTKQRLDRAEMEDATAATVAG